MHSDFTALMSLVLDGEASVQDEGRLRQHLNSCDTCAATWNHWRALDARLSAAPLVAPAHSLVSDVLARLDEHGERRRHQRYVVSGLLLAWGATVAGLVLVSVVLLWWSYTQPLGISLVLASGAQALTALAWWLEGLQSILVVLGGNSLPAGVGLMLCFTACVAALWVWLVRRSTGWKDAGFAGAAPQQGD